MCHLIFVCKYRKKLLVKFGKEIKTLFYKIAESNNFGIQTIEVDKDHIHLLISYNPTQSVLQIVRLLKQISTYRIWRQNDNKILLSKHFWKNKHSGVMDILLVLQEW